MPHPQRELEIGPTNIVRRLFGWAAFIGAIVVLGAVFVWLFTLLTHNWQIAIGSATVLIGFMALAGWWAERSASGSDNTMR